MAAQLVADALLMAIWRRGKPDAMLHHSNQASQYTSEQFQKLLADHGVSCSISRSGNVWDNAAMESFFSWLKPSGQPARCIARYIEPGTRPGPTCSTTSSGSTIRVHATPSSGISALWNSSGTQRQLRRLNPGVFATQYRIGSAALTTSDVDDASQVGASRTRSYIILW